MDRLPVHGRPQLAPDATFERIKKNAVFQRRYRVQIVPIRDGGGVEPEEYGSFLKNRLSVFNRSCRIALRP